MSKIYEIFIFTASLKLYGEPVIDYIDQKKLVSFRLFRENCSFKNKAYIKDLSLLNRNIKDVILLDNSRNSCILNPENCILIKNFFDDKNDKELENLSPFLEYLSKIEDVRPIEKWESVFKSMHFNSKSDNNVEKTSTEEDISQTKLLNNNFLVQKEPQRSSGKISRDDLLHIEQVKLLNENKSQLDDMINQKKQKLFKQYKSRPFVDVRRYSQNNSKVNTGDDSPSKKPMIKQNRPSLQINTNYSQFNEERFLTNQKNFNSPIKLFSQREDEDNED